MAADNLTITLTSEQQQQIRESTGKHVSQIDIKLAAKGQLTAEELDQVAGGSKKTTDTTTPAPK
jgi:hypothetical protein